MSRAQSESPRVVIAGGGVAALETMLALRALARAHIEITLLTPEREFNYRPVTVAEPFERGEARSYDVQAILDDQGGGELVWGTLAEVEDKVAVTGSGERIPFDELVIAIGAAARDPFAGALTFKSRATVPALRKLLDELADGTASSVALALPSERAWPLPLYELAVMTAANLRERGAGHVKVSLVTPEEEPLALFGSAAAAAIVPLLAAHGIRLWTSSMPAFARRGELVLVGGGVVPAKRVITLPLFEGRRLSGVPHDRHGFIPVDSYGRVRGLDHVYAAGDITSFPLKQGGLAAQQADAVAEVIAAGLGAQLTPRPFHPVLRGLLMTGGAPLYLRAEPQHAGRPSSVAIEAARERWSGRERSSASGQPLWWPPAKIAGRYLSPYLATARPQPLASELLTDRVPVPGPAVTDDENEEALELALLLADCDARWGDYAGALTALDAAEALAGALSPEYEDKRRHWLTASRRDG